VTRLMASSIAGRQAQTNKVPLAFDQNWDYDTDETYAWGTVSHRPPSSVVGHTNPEVVIVRVQSDPTGWVSRTIVKLNQLSQLQANWDSYGAKPIDRNAVLMALSLIGAIHSPHVPEPTIVPLPSGGLQFEWHTLQKDLEVSISPNGQTSVYFEQTGRAPTISEGNISDLLGEIQSLVRFLG